MKGLVLTRARTRFTRLACAAAAVAACGLGASQLAQGAFTTAANPPTTDPGAAPQIQAPVSAVDASVAERYGLFRRQARPDDDVSGIIASAARSTAMFGQNYELSRKVESTSDATLYVVPGAEMLCNVLDKGVAGHGVGCVPESVGAEQGAITTTGSSKGPQYREVYGYAPDWVKWVRFVLPDKTTMSTPVTRNGFSVTVPAGVTTAALLGESESMTVQVPNP